jgi:glycosyltransferase involved in cell wall biosynthesis
MKFSLSVLIPCFNVQSSVESVVRDVYKTANKIASPLEIIAVDDGSTDATNKVLRRLAPDIPHLKIINHDRNMGYGRTMVELYDLASNEWLFTLPGDGQYDPSDLTKLFPYRTRADMILGWRKYRSDPPIRILQSRIYNQLLNSIFHIGLHDVNTIRLMKRSVIRALPLTSVSAFMDAELAVRAKRKGFTIMEIPVTHRARSSKGATGGNFFRTILPTVVDIIRFALR